MTGRPAKATDQVRVQYTGRRHGGRHSSGEEASDLHRLSERERVGPIKLLRFPAVRERTGLSRSTIWRLERQGAFPQHHRISPNAVAWVEDDIASWIRSKVNEVAV